MPDTAKSAADAARSSIHSWMLRHHGQALLRDEEKIRAVTDYAQTNLNLELVTNWNPSAGVVEARWRYGDRDAEGLERPSSSESIEEACLLACGAFVRLVIALQADSPDQT